MSHAQGPPPAGSYESIARLEAEAVRPLASDVRVRLLQEGTTGGVSELAERAAALSERRAELHGALEGTEFRRSTDEEIARWRELARASRIEDLATARRVWGEIEAGCASCHEAARGKAP